MTRKRGKVFTYWWDFKHYNNAPMTLIIESDDDVVPVLKEYQLPETGTAHNEINAAMRIIEDLRSGRISHPKSKYEL